MKFKGLFGLAVFSLFSISFLGLNANKERPVVLNTFAYYNNHDADTYYSEITNDLISYQLLNKLRAINSTKLKSRVGYNSMMSQYRYTDPGKTSNTITAFYNGGSGSSSSMNKEHVWPASRTVLGRDNDPLEDDIHMTRPTFTSDNSSRGNEFFVEGATGVKNTGWDPNQCGNETYRGDAARIIFYCVVADSQLSLVDNVSDYTSNHTMGKLSDLLKWNLQYPVLERENVRNEYAEYLQGNRNPFIDHPEYACRIWGNTNATTKSICGGQDTSGIAIYKSDGTELPSTNELAVDDSINLFPYFNKQKVSDPSKVTWSLIQYNKSNPYTGNAVIKTTFDTVGISLSVKEDVSFGVKLTYKDGTQVRAKFKFGKGSSDTPKKKSTKSGCQGEIMTTSVILSTLSVFGLGLLLIKRKVNKND